MVNQGEHRGHGELDLAWEGMFSSGTHRSLSRKIIELMREKANGPQITQMLMSECKIVYFFFWDANME